MAQPVKRDVRKFVSLQEAFSVIESRSKVNHVTADIGERGSFFSLLQDFSFGTERVVFRFYLKSDVAIYCNDLFIVTLRPMRRSKTIIKSLIIKDIFQDLQKQGSLSYDDVCYPYSMGGFFERLFY